MIAVEDFSKEAKCVYKDEQYSVRDNGAVLRHPREGKKPRPTDNQWTFGKPNEKTGYMEISTARIHRIVATAFHGEPPTPEHIVDHIDTNRQNNCPENLRWLTRLENALNNPITRARIIHVCGSIEAFIADPSILRDNSMQDPNFTWMRTVSPEEAKVCRDRLEEWAKSDGTTSGGKLGEWVFNERHSAEVFRAPFVKPSYQEEQKSDLFESKIQGAAQRKWRTPCEFPFCPLEPSEDPIAKYVANLKIGEVFSRNDYGESIILDFAVKDQSIIVMTEFKQDEPPIKPWAVAKITYEDGLYIHTSIGSCFEEIGARKWFTEEQGLKWEGEETFDDLVG